MYNNKMRTVLKSLFGGLFLMAIFAMYSCSEIEIPEHNLDVEFQYELVCSEAFLKYATPQVVVTDGNGTQQTLEIEDDMWEGTGHKTWSISMHYDSLNVSNTMTVKYIPKPEVTYQDEKDFDNVHYLSGFIIVKEDEEGRRNNYTIVPDYPAKANVTASALKLYIENLSGKTTIRGGKVDKNGEITKVETD